MLTSSQLENIMHYYLQSKLGAAFSPERMTEVNTQVLAQALKFYSDLTGDYLSLAAIGSVGTTHDQHADQEKILFRMLDGSLQTSGADADYQITGFDQNQARQLWLAEKAKINVSSLTELHGNAANLGIAEKFLLGKMHGQEWLTDLDLERLAKLCGIKDEISITRLNPLDIGTLLHFKRRGHSSEKPYSVPLLLNKGSSGDVSSQGSHWVATMLLVDPVKKEIKVQFRDSMHMSSIEQDKIKAELTKAIHYKQTTADVPPKVYQAFPGFSLNFDMAATATPVKQKDNWSCGYRAFKNVVDLMKPQAVTNPNLKEIVELPEAEVTSDNLRSIIYRQLLSEVEISPAALKDATIDNNIVDQHGKINTSYLNDFVEHVAKVKPNRAPIKLSPAQLQELKEIDELAAKELTKLEEKFKPEYESDDEHWVRPELDFEELLNPDDSKMLAKAKIKAIATFYNNYATGGEVIVNNLNVLTDPELIQYAIKQFNTAKSFFHTENHPDTQHPLLKELNLLSARNRFIKMLKIKVEDDEDPWQEIWRNRISNGSIFQDGVNLLGELNLYSSSMKEELRLGVNYNVEIMMERYLSELLKFLGKNKDFFQSTENGFPYKKLRLTSGGRGEFGEAALKEIDIITEWCENNHYFPFTEITLAIPELNDESFEKFKRFLVALNKAGVKTLELKCFDKASNQVDFTSQQYDELIALYKENNITLAIGNRDLSETADQTKDKKMQLENAFVINNRRLNIERGLGKRRKPSAEAVTDLSSDDDAPKKSKNIRPYKLRNFDVRQNLNLEMNVEQQLEMQQQHQLQTQLSQEVQQQVQLQEQSQTEIDDAGGEFQGESLIDVDSYTGEMEYFVGLINGLGIQNYRRYNIGSPGDQKIFWQEAFGYAPYLPKSIKYVTQSALSKIHTTPQHFVYGINIDNLPEGFFVQQHENRFVLCFDETKFIENKNQSPLTVKLTAQPAEVILLGDQRAFMPDNTEPSRENKHLKGEKWTLEKFYDLLRGLNEDPDVDLVGQFKQKYQWYLEDFATEYNVTSKISSNSIYSLVEILHFEGHQGLETFLTALKRLNNKDPELYENFKRSFVTGRKNITSLLSPSNINVLNELPSMSSIEKKWWRQLVAQHTLNNSPIDPVVLYEGFQHFLKRLREANIPLPFECPITACGNMLVGLDRLLAILGKVSPRNLADQLENLRGLSFYEDGAWYAGRWLNFHYFHPAMELSNVKIDMASELYLLERDADQLTYKIDYADLVKVANKADKSHLNYAFTLFHRYMGTASRINANYQYYVDLLASLRQQPRFEQAYGAAILPLLALTTSGERGCESQDPIPLFTIFELMFTDENAKRLLSELSASLNTWSVIPNLEELTSIVNLLANSSYDRKAAIAMLAVKPSVATLEAIKLWDKNTRHVGGNKFFTLFGLLQTFDADNIDYLAKIVAKLRLPTPQEDIDKFLDILKQIKSKDTYGEIIKTLAAIDLDKTDHNNLPTLGELNTVLTILPNNTAKQEIFPFLALNLPRCKFNLASYSIAPPADFASAMQQSLDDFNAILKEYNIAPMEGNDLQKDLGKNIQLKMQEIEAKVVKDYGPMAWNMVKDSKVYGKVMKVARDAIFSSLNVSAMRFPQLGFLRENKFPEPVLKNKYDSIGENIVTLTEYTSNINELFNSLLQLRSRWSDFDIDFLFNSPRTDQFTPAQMQRIFSAINLIEVSFIPATMLQSIFADKPFTRDDKLPVNTEQLTKAICQIIELQALDLGQRARLIDIVTTAKDPAILDELVKTLQLVKEKNPAILNDCFSVLELYYKENSDTRAIKAIANLLTLFADEAEVARIYFHALSKNINVFLNVSDMILEDIDPARKAQFARMIAYSCLEQEADANETLASDDTINQLAKFSKTAEFDQLSKLYQQRPYPKLAKLKQFLALENDGARQEFINDYEFDPPGLRAKRSTLETQFDISTIDERIDSIRDLSRDTKNPLFYTQRKVLREELTYVTIIGDEHKLAVPGVSTILNAKDDLEDYRKPASKLTKQQLQTLIRHYREVISSGLNDRAEIELAKLEFVALAREAMYRTTAKFPYSTQVLSLLNVMMHGGNTFSEIRTGEGKGCITALFAASKWMEGGAVDVCSSNMELAGRDLEEFSDYFEYLGIETQLVRAKTKHADYKQDGINYSDVSELALFQQQCELLQQKLPDKVSLVLDEADFISLDNTTQFRFATSLDASFDPHFNPHEWLYPIILEFVASDQFNNKVDPMDKVEDIRALKEFVASHSKLKNAEKSKFYKINDVQLDKWIDSAYTASQLVEGEDFAVRETHIVREGQSIPVQVARVKILHRENADSSFSNGVHQFLHTRLNLEIEAKKRDGKKFPIEPEKTYLASKSAKNFIDYYTRRGNVLGLTGTVGSEQEIKELRKNYGFKFYKIPPHKPLVRTDHKPMLATRKRKGFLWLQRETAKEAHFRTILEQAKFYRSRGQPVLVFADGVASSQELYDYLIAQLGPGKLQLYNGEQLGVREKDVTDRTGLSEWITVTTPMLGRGNDFKPRYDNGDPVIEGLAVLETDIGPDRDSGQKIGRSGRNNARGDTRLIASEEEFTKRDMKVPTSEAELINSIETIKATMTKQNFVQRRERQLFADIKDQFFIQYIQGSRELKANVENFYQQLRSTGAAETWKPLQHECHLLWEQFLNKIDSQWNELVVGLHNELSKLSEADKEVAEQKLLHQKVVELTTFANKEWADTLQAIQTTSNEKLTTDYAQACKRMEKINNQPLPAEVLALATPNIKLTKYKAEPFKSSPVPIYDEVMPASISYKPLEASDFNSAMIYTLFTGSNNTEINAIQFITELNNIYSKVFKHGEPAGRFAPATQIQMILQKLLGEHHDAHAQGLHKTHTQDLITRLMYGIALYDDEKFKQVAYKAYTDHVKDHKKEADYLYQIASDMFRMRNIGALPRAAKIDNQELLGMTDDQVWEDMVKYAEKELNSYSWSMFKSADRSKTLVKMQDELAHINASTDAASEKINKLVAALNKISITATSTDLYLDKQKSKWTIFSHRNVTGSRFQDALARIKDKAMSYSQVMPAQQLQNDQSIDYLRTLLQQLLERTRLVRIRDHATVNKMRADVLMTGAIDRMASKDNPMETEKDLILILQHLKAYSKTFAKDKSVLQDSSLTAYIQFTNDIISRIQKYQFAQKSKELAKDDRKSTFYNSGALVLRDTLQTVVEKLLQRDYVAEKKLNLKKYASIIPGDTEDAKLAQTVLFEIERKLKAQYPNVKTIEIVKSKTSYSNEMLHAGFKLTFNNQEVFNLPITIRSLTKRESRNDFAFVQVPEFYAETVAPINKTKHGRSKSEATPTSTPTPPASPKKPNKAV
jgi:hypothetical protein